MSGLLVEHSYEPIAVDKMEAVKDEVENLPPGINGGTAQWKFLEQWY